MDRFKAYGAAAVTLLTGGLVVWWLYLVSERIGVKPEVEMGSVVLDEWGRAKDILLVVLPLFSASIAYWVGAQVGAKETSEAKTEAAGAKGKLEAVLDASPQGTLETAKEKHPEAFTAAT